MAGHHDYVSSIFNAWAWVVHDTFVIGNLRWTITKVLLTTPKILKKGGGGANNYITIMLKVLQWVNEF